MIARVSQAVFGDDVLHWFAKNLELWWALVVVGITLYELNPAPILGVIAYLVFVYSPLSTKGSTPYFWYQRNILGRTVKEWFFEDGFALILATAGLFFVMPWQMWAGWGPGYMTLNSPSGIRVESGAGIALHMPVYDTINYWPVSNKVTLSPTATTLDGKKVSADVSVELAMDDSASVVLSIAQKYGSRGQYWNSLENAVTHEFQVSVSRVPLAQVPNVLLLEDRLGTRMGLENLSQRWAGKIVIDKIHRLADPN